MTKRLYTLLSILLPFFGVAQQANSWINYGQQYYELRVGTDAIVRLDSATLANAGIPLGTIDARNFQVFGRGQEVPIYVEGEGDGVLNAADFIEFFAEANDGWMDSVLYGVGNNPNPHYSVIHDTASYYLTWNTSITNLRATVETDTSFGSYTANTHIWKSKIAMFNSTFYYGQTNAVGGTDPQYHEAEGWGNSKFGKGATQTLAVSTNDYFPTGPSPTVFGVLTGQSDYASITNDHHLTIGRLSVNYVDSIFAGYKKIDFNFQIPISAITSTSTTIDFSSINDIAPADPNFVDNMAVHYVGIKYPHTMSFSNVNFDKVQVQDHGTQAKSLLVISNFTGTGGVVMYDVDNGRRIPVVQNGAQYRAIVPNSGSDKRVVISSVNAAITPTPIPVFGTGNFTSYHTLGLDSAYVIVTHPNLITDANAYAAYRSGQGYNTMVVDINQLYHQFAYGVREHPLAIRNMAQELIDSFPSAPQNLFLIGKSVKDPLRRKSQVNTQMSLVPTMGNPSADLLFTAGLNSTLLEPAIPTGRLSANTSGEVSLYLTKVIDYETAPRAMWMKDILHFAGGTNASESQLFTSYLNVYKSTLEDTLFGGNVTTFQKTSTAPIQITLSDSIKNMISRGTSLMTFFGHASATGGFDQNVDDPSEWNNYQKYPLVVGNACFAGDIHLDNNASTSEKFVIIGGEGAIGFISGVGLGVPSYLHQYSNNFFWRFGQTQYGNTLGSLMKSTIKGIQGLGNDPLVRSTCWEMTLHGDPALRINPANFPDYEINNQSVYFTPADVTTDIDSFQLNLVITNLGKAVGDSIAVEITRHFPLNNYPDTVAIKVIPGTRYRDTIPFWFPVDPVNGIGLNTFDIVVDALNNVAELSEFNNSITTTLFIRSGDLIPVYPHEYAIMPDQGITLKASTGLPFKVPQTYVFELDTNDSFGTPFKQSFTVTKNGAVVEWTAPPLLAMPDSQVYFWRVSPDSASVGSWNWRESSFQYISGRRGAGQAHFHQFKKDGYKFINYNKPNRSFDFVNTVRQLFCRTYGDPIIAELWDVLYKLDNDVKAYGGISLANAMHLAVLDSVTLEPWNSGLYKWGQANEDSVGNKLGIFIFRENTPAQMTAMQNMITDSVPDGNYILGYTWVTPHYTTWPASVVNAFTNLGADTLQYLGDSIPYIFLVKKGDPNSAIQIVGDSIDMRIDLIRNVNISSTYGTITSEVFGPATRWDSLWWRHRSLENPSLDSLTLDVIGVDLNGTPTIVIDDIPSDSLDMAITSKVNPAVYPFIQLQTYMSDDSMRTAAQLDRWQLIYEGVPECAINPDIHFSFHADTVYQGESISLEVAIENIGDYDMDSLLISYQVVDGNNNVFNIPYARQKPLLKDSVLVSVLSFSTTNMSGGCNLYIDVNPNNDQLEQHHFNNLGQLPFFVIDDDVNPILDVTFDGIHILDGDIVSARPNIAIRLSDENQFLALNDTADFEVYLTPPGGTKQRVYFKDATGADVMTFVPANLPNNSCRIDWNPTLSTDGIYTLEVVAQDRAANASGDHSYLITFEVINKSTISNMVNYPNPFSTCTHFVFTLTGSQVPDNLQIQIMTVTGKVVRNITIDELGPLHIGNNKTPYCWDGRDDFGDQLANGIYLYRVNNRLNGETIEHRATSADKFFKKGYGKMYLLR